MILIFDLDKTVTKDCFRKNTENLERLRNIMRFAENDPSTKIYVVTARIMEYYLDRNKNSIDELLADILSYDVPKEIVNFFHHKNNYRKLHEWVLCNISKKDLENITRKFLNGYKHNFDIGMLSGIHKMIQINFIAKKEQINDWCEVIFFDDAIDNMEAYKLFCKEFNPSMKRMIFVGGNGEDVEFPSHDEWEWAVNRARIVS